MFKGFLIGVVLTVLVIMGGTYYYFSSGMAPVATNSAPMPFERLFARLALRAKIQSMHVGPSPVAADETTYMAGAQVYKDNCAMCHGLPNQPPPAVAPGMFPHPPQLWRGHGVTDDPPSETYWKVANGIRMTGMPAFSDTLNNTQMWQVAELLANANKISDNVRQQLVPAPPAEATPPAAAKENSKERRSPRSK